MRRGVVLVALLVALIAGCGKKVILSHGAEQTIVDVVSRQTGLRPTDVRCPSGVQARVGGTFQCHFKGPEGSYTAYMRITNVQGSKVLFDVRTRRNG